MAAQNEAPNAECQKESNFIQKGRITRSKGRKKAEALEDLLPAFKATALPWQSITGEPLEPPLVPEAAYKTKFPAYD